MSGHLTMEKRIRMFWDRVIVDKKTGCEIWTGHKKKTGHGITSFKGNTVSAHRFAWMFLVGAIPRGKSVLHKCNVPSCVNVSHLYIGTPQDNMADRDRAGRQAKGERCGASKLKESDVVEIFRMYNIGWKRGDLAWTFGVTKYAVARILEGTNWKHLKLKKINRNEHARLLKILEVNMTAGGLGALKS